MGRSTFFTAFLYMVSLGGAVSETTSPASTSMGTSSQTITESPAENINYTLLMFNDGPAVLDSEITFTARLVDKRGKVAQSKEFMYEWNNNADRKFEYVSADLEYKYVRKFSSASVKHGQWVMNLVVYSGKMYEHMVNFTSSRFILTETLNGFIELHQDLVFKRNENIFSTSKPIRLHANHTDKFGPSNIKKPTFQFFWYRNNDFQRSTTVPQYDMEIDTEGNYTIQTELYAFFDDLHGNGQNSSFKLQLVDACDNLNLKSLRSPVMKRKRKLADKCGIFTHHLTVKEPLSSVNVTGHRNAVKGQYLNLTVTCKGSQPSSLCWNITVMNSSQPNLNDTCPPNKFKETCTHVVEIKLTELGWKTVWFTVYNDVSYMSYPINVYCYDPDSVNIPALTIPLVFGTFGLIVIIIGVTYLNRLRKKTVIEVADFDFHPSVSETNINIFSRLMNKLKVTLRRKATPRTTIPQHEETRAKQFESSSLYGSL